MSGEGAAVSQRTVRRLYGQRQEAADPSDRWFAVYVVLLMLSIYALPTALVVGDSLDGTSAAALTSDGAATAVSAGFSLLALLVLLLGTLQGPAYLTPFLAQTLLAGAIDRRRVLLRPVLSAWLLCVLAGTAAAATAGIAMVRTPEWGSAELARFLGAGAAAGCTWDCCGSSVSAGGDGPAQPSPSSPCCLRSGPSCRFCRPAPCGSHRADGSGWSGRARVHLLRGQSLPQSASWVQWCCWLFPVCCSGCPPRP